jgi:hypothetical protein
MHRIRTFRRGPNVDLLMIQTYTEEDYLHVLRILYRDSWEWVEDVTEEFTEWDGYNNVIIVVKNHPDLSKGIYKTPFNSEFYNEYWNHGMRSHNFLDKYHVFRNYTEEEFIEILSEFEDILTEELNKTLI